MEEQKKGKTIQINMLLKGDVIIAGITFSKSLPSFLKDCIGFTEITTQGRRGCLRLQHKEELVKKKK